MARLINWPRDLMWTSNERLGGPRAEGQVGERRDGSVQTIASAFGLWRYRFTFPPLSRSSYRRWRGFITALHAGANATRVNWCDPDGMTWAELGVTASENERRAGIAFENGAAHSNGRLLGLGRPTASVNVAAAIDTSIIQLAGDTWGHSLDIGDVIGFEPFHFGWYEITDVIADGQYRIWPRLRKAIDTTNRATLNPVIVMRMESEGSATVGRQVDVAEGLEITLLEVPDSRVRSIFTD